MTQTQIAKQTNGADKQGPFYMAGSEKTGQYVVIAKTARGRLGVRVLSGGSIKNPSKVGTTRIRVEPIHKDSLVNKMSPEFAGWKKPGQDNQHRFSTMASDFDGLKAAIKAGVGALGVSDGLTYEIGPDAPRWARRMVEQMKA